MLGLFFAANAWQSVQKLGESRLPVAVYSLVATVGGPRLDVELLASLGTDLHQWGDSGSYPRKLLWHSFLVCQGLGVEALHRNPWIERFIPVGHCCGQLRWGGRAHAKGAGVHAWLALLAAARMVGLISKKLGRSDPSPTAEHDKRAHPYIGWRLELDGRYRSDVSAVPDPALVSQHPPLGCRISRYGLHILSVLQDISGSPLPEAGCARGSYWHGGSIDLGDFCSTRHFQEQGPRDAEVTGAKVGFLDPWDWVRLTREFVKT
ncbi:metal ABC transporter solute-binding protein, Zn/Mn family [Candidatus Methylacidithermus pantelleriae]|uniref:Uncharacterized protein n=1 Tax=Candidatus Methylacidithermus pantelleriae TaxID=2744239 RepID=A0A8J2BK43_9BACT|nr:zinc ABC transporter substrate-binding protein [Candidatus Methylacidithermus pantelleriae]CAF0691934.1 hypothetical protein MPNT_110028 [Candidatus Methylacidithermus pantelleriae]